MEFTIELPAPFSTESKTGLAGLFPSMPSSSKNGFIPGDAGGGLVSGGWVGEDGGAFLKRGSAQADFTHQSKIKTVR